MTRTWEPSGDGNLRCVAHGHVFSKIRTCPDCKPAETQIAVEGADAPVPAPSGCKSAEALERTLNGVLDKALEQRDKALKGNSRPSQSIAVKWTEVALKAIRAAGEYARSREDWVRMARLEERRKALKNRGASN